MDTYLALVFAAVAAFGVTALLGFVMIPWLIKLINGQNIIGMLGDSKKPRYAPSMGGVILIIGFAAAFAAVIITDKLMGGDIVAGQSVVTSAVYTKLFAGLIMALTLGLIGFADDYLKNVKGLNLGFTVRQKLLMQVLTVIAYLGSLRLAGCSYMFVPFYGATVDLGILFFVIGIIMITATVNGVGTCDSVDGLCCALTLVSGASLVVISLLRGNTGAAVTAAGISGGCAGLLLWNKSPARVRLGSSGTMFLGGIIAATAYAFDCPLILLPVGAVYLVQGISCVVRRSGALPLHRCLENRGWGANRIVLVFTLVNIIGCALGTALIYFGR